MSDAIQDAGGDEPTGWERNERDRRLIELAQPAIDHAEALAITQIMRFARQRLLIGHPRMPPLLRAAI